MMRLEERALQQFDRLVERGNLLWEENAPRLVHGHPFNFQFRAATSLTLKPNLQRNDPGRTRDCNAFSDEDPDFFLEHVGQWHTLILNKYCVVRPQYVLHTNVFAPQAEHLSASDLAAAWSVLARLDSPHMVIYNCGIEAGSSLGHKHLQILPRPPSTEFNLFPNTIGIMDETCIVPGIPFQHAVKRLSSEPTTTEVYEVYEALVATSGVHQAPAHNVILVPDWMLVVPRSCARLGRLSANAAAMVGMVWVTKEDDLQGWLDQGPMDMLGMFGVKV